MSKSHKTFGPNIIIKMETGEIKVGSFVIASETSREATAREEAVIESVGEDAFSDILEENRPKVGDKIVIARYSGKSLGTYPDGLERRVLVDTGVLAIVIEEAQ